MSEFIDDMRFGALLTRQGCRLTVRRRAPCPRHGGTSIGQPRQVALFRNTWVLPRHHIFNEHSCLLQQSSNHVKIQIVRRN